MQLETILTLVAGLVGWPALWALLVDVLKWAGVVRDGDAGRWAAAGNLIALLVLAGVVNFYPQFDVAAADQQAAEFAKFLALVFGYIVQIVSAKSAHGAYADRFGWASFAD